MADIESPLIFETAALNVNPAPEGMPPNSSPNIVYSEGRESLAMLKRWWNRVGPTVTSGGSANAQTLTYSVTPTEGYKQGQHFSFIAGFNNSGATTLNVNGLGAKNVFLGGSALTGGEIISGSVVVVAYDGTQFHIVAASAGRASPIGYLPLAGGTLTGGLTVAPAGAATLTLNKNAGGVGSYILGQTGGLSRWQLTVGNNTAEPGSGNVGSDFNINRYNDAGTIIDSPLTITRSTGTVAISGTGTNDNAATGQIGEVISSNVTGAITLTNATPINITSISLTAGDWDVSGEVWVTIGVSATLIHTGISVASATVPGGTLLNQARNTISTALSAVTQVLPLRTARASLASTTTYYLIVQANFPSGTTTTTGNIIARRAR